jgi:glycosyltransferase involved in cell wall biosynthesis
MRAADLFVLPTHYDPFGLVIIEAMASGLPVITTSRAGATEIMADGVDGLVLDDPDDAVALANSVMDLLGAPERRQAMGVAARETVLNYDWRRVAARIEHLLLQDPAACAIP